MRIRTLATCLTLIMALPLSAEPRRILALGDSLFAYHRLTGDSVIERLAALLDSPITDRSHLGARFFPRGMTHRFTLSPAIPGQAGDATGWDWVLIAGGGNDLLLGCRCRDCTDMLDRLISADGRHGALPALVARFRAEGARVIVSGYLHSPGFFTLTERCEPVGRRFEARLTRLAGRDDGVSFLDNSDLVPPGGSAYYNWDRLHPSRRGAAALARRLAALITRHAPPP